MSAKFGWCLTGDHAACPGAATASDALVPACGCTCHAMGSRPRPLGESDECGTCNGFGEVTRDAPGQKGVVNPYIEVSPCPTCTSASLW